MSVEITVRGEHVTRVRPDRGTLHARIVRSASSGGEAFAAVAEGVRPVRESLEQVHDPVAGPVLQWSVDRLHTWAERPWDDERGRRAKKLVHHGAVTVVAVFVDAEQLAHWVAEHVEVPGFEVIDVEWSLLEDHRLGLERDGRVEAVRAALDKAQDYADAAGLAQVRPVAIADAGMLGEGSPREDEGDDRAMLLSAGDGAGDHVPLAPKDVVVATRVDVRVVVA